MAPPYSVVQQLRLEVDTRGSQEGRQLPERLSQLFHNRLLAVLTEELTGYQPAGASQLLPQLVLDLEPVTMARLEHDLPERLRAALRQALAGLVPPAAGTPGEAAPLNDLHHALLYGDLPWQARSRSFSTDGSLEQALRQQPGALRALLQAVGKHAAARQRLARQLSWPTLSQLLDFLEPGHSPLVRAYLYETLAAHRRAPLVPATTTTLRQVLYELVIADLLVNRHTQFNRRAFVERQIRQLAAHYNLEVRVLLRQLITVLPLAHLASTAADTLPTILHALHEHAQPPTGTRPRGSAQEAAHPGSRAGTPGPAALEADARRAGLATPDYAALVYYARHSSLPPLWEESFSQATLVQALETSLRQGPAALRQLAQAAGPAATVAVLARHLPPAQRQLLLHTLAPGQARVLLAMLAELAGQALPSQALAYQQQLWQQTVAWLLAAPASLPTPRLRQWLQQQLPPPGPAQHGPPDKLAQHAPYRLGQPATSDPLRVAGGLLPGGPPGEHSHAAQSRFVIREQLFDYLQFGWSASPGAATAGQLQGELRVLLAEAPALLIRFVRQHVVARPVLRHLAALADFAVLARLVASRRLPAALATLFDGPGRGPGAVRRQFLREAYLRFYFPVPGAPPPAGPIVGELLGRYQLPARALLAFLHRQQLRQPLLAGSVFVGWLTRTLAAQAGAPLSAGNQPGEAARSGPRATRQGLPPLEAGLLLTATSSPLPLVSLAPAMAYPAAGLAHWLHPLSPRPGLRGSLVPGEFARRPPPSPAGVPMPSGPALPAAYRLAGTATLAEAQELLSRYLLAETAPLPAVLRPLLRWVVARQPVALLALLRRYATLDRVWPRLARVADFAILDQLLAAHRRTGPARPGLAGLDALLAGPRPASRLAGFLKMAYLLTHLHPAGAPRGAVLWQLATASGLPRQAVLTWLQQSVQRYPALAATRLFRHLTDPAAGLAPATVYPVGTRPGGAALPAAVPAWANLGTGTTRPLFPSFGPKSLPPGQAASAEATPADHNLLLHYLQHGQGPWWHAGPVSATALGHTLRRTLRQPQPLRQFLQQHAHQATVQRHLAQLADFGLLHELLPGPGLGRSRRQVVRPALAALDRHLRYAAGRLGRLHRLLLEAYVAFATQPATTNPLAPLRRLAAAAGWSWRAVLAQSQLLLRQYPALAADLFFGSLLQAASRLAMPGRRLALAVAQAAWTVVQQYVETGQHLTTKAATQQALTTLLRSPHAVLLTRLRPYLALPTVQHRLAALAADGQLAALLQHVWPGAIRQLAALVRDWRQLVAAGLVTASYKDAGLWAEVLAVAAETPLARPAALVRRLLLAESAGGPPAPVVLRLLRDLARQRLVLRSSLVALLAALLPAPGAARRPAALTSPTATAASHPTGAVALPQPASPAPPYRPAPMQPAPATTIYIDNAGLVLLWPFFTLLLDRLGYLAQRQFKTPELAGQATYLLHYLVTGTEEAPEHRLALNKLLCGVERATPLPRPEPLPAAARATAEDLLRAMLSQWEVLKNTSIANLRDTFLQRPGRLDWLAGHVTLTVEAKTVDVLFDRRPWSISLIKLPWMLLPLHVTWR
jgi:hypothetical protein